MFFTKILQIDGKLWYLLKIIPFDIILSDIKQRIEIFHEFSTACLFNPVEFEKLVKDLTLLNIDKIYAKNFFMVFQEGSLNMLFIKPFVFYQESQELFFLIVSTWKLLKQDHRQCSWKVFNVLLVGAVHFLYISDISSFCKHRYFHVNIVKPPVNVDLRIFLYTRISYKFASQNTKFRNCFFSNLYESIKYKIHSRISKSRPSSPYTNTSDISTKNSSYPDADIFEFTTHKVPPTIRSEDSSSRYPLSQIWCSSHSDTLWLIESS